VRDYGDLRGSVLSGLAGVRSAVVAAARPDEVCTYSGGDLRCAAQASGIV
jgi:hypothetical protein